METNQQKGPFRYDILDMNSLAKSFNHGELETQ